MAVNTEALRRYELVVVRGDGTRYRAGFYDSSAGAIQAFKDIAEPTLRARVEDVAEDREVWLTYADVHRKKQPPQPTPPSIVFTAWGETKNIMAWSRDPRCVCSLQLLKSRLARTRKQWTPEEALSTPPKQGIKAAELAVEKAKRYEAFGETKTITEWLSDPRCEANPLWFRALISRGVPCEQALVGLVPDEYRKSGHFVTAWGETKSITEWSKDPRCTISWHRLSEALAKGIAPELAMGGHTLVLSTRKGPSVQGARKVATRGQPED